MARALRRAGRDDLLARREELGLHLLATEGMLVFGGRRHDRRGAAPRHRDGRGEAIRGHSRTERSRLCVLLSAVLCASATPEEPQKAATLPPCKRRLGKIRQPSANPNSACQ